MEGGGEGGSIGSLLSPENDTEMALFLLCAGLINNQGHSCSIMEEMPGRTEGAYLCTPPLHLKRGEEKMSACSFNSNS